MHADGEGEAAGKARAGYSSAEVGRRLLRSREGGEAFGASRDGDADANLDRLGDESKDESPLMPNPATGRVVDRRVMRGWSNELGKSAPKAARGPGSAGRNLGAPEKQNRETIAEPPAGQGCGEFFAIPNLEEEEATDCVFEQVAAAPQNRTIELPPLTELGRDLLHAVPSADSGVNLMALACTLIPARLVIENDDEWDFNLLLVEVARDVGPKKGHKRNQREVAAAQAL